MSFRQSLLPRPPIILLLFVKAYCLILSLILATAGCSQWLVRTSIEHGVPRFSVYHSTGGWGYTREWRVFEDRLEVGRPHGSDEKGAPVFVIEYSRELSLAQFQRLAFVWSRLDERLWTHSVEFEILHLSDGPSYGLIEFSNGKVLRGFGCDSPIPEMMPAVEAIANLLPSSHRPWSGATSSKYTLQPRPLKN